MANFRDHVRAEHVDDSRIFENPAEFLRRAMIPNLGIQEDFLEESSTRVFSKDVARHLLFFEAPCKKRDTCHRSVLSRESRRR